MFKVRETTHIFFLASAPVSVVQLPLENEQKPKKESKKSGPIPLLGLDFNLATSIFSSQLDILENNFPSPTKKQEEEKKETQQDLLE